MELAGLYTPLPIALAELKRRRSDKAFMKKVSDYFKDLPPLEELRDEPKAVMARALVTANLEFEHFMHIREQLPLKSVFYEFRNDSFAHVNPEKKALGHMVFYKADPKGNREITGRKRIVNFDLYQGKPIDTVQTTGGENLVDFHHRLITTYFPGAQFDIVDFSKWFKKSKKYSSAYPYLRYLGLFLVNGILFENFTDRKDEQPFNEAVVIPSFNKLVEVFGLPPIIVPIEPLEVDDQPYWCYYDEKIQSMITPS